MSSNSRRTFLRLLEKARTYDEATGALLWDSRVPIACVASS